MKLGRRQAVEDDRVPLMSDLISTALPAPPAAVNFYAGIGEWGMLANDSYGCCVEAAAGHADLQFRNYAVGETLVVPPTDDEVLAAYAGATGFDATDPSTDQGTVILGAGGFMQYWHRTGIVFGGVRSFAKAFVQVKLDGDLLSLRQAIHYFGGVLVGIDLPENVVAGAEIPYMWDKPGGKIAGGHCIWVDGFEEADQIYLDLISWGQRCRMSQAFLNGTYQEAVAVYDPAVLDKRGLNPDGFDVATLMNAMKAIRTA